MDTLFFWASKLVWVFLSPGNILVFLMLAACLAMVIGKQTLGKRLLFTTTALTLVIAILPIGEWLIAPLENRFPQPSSLPTNVDGVIVLGGSVSPQISQNRNQPQLNESADRLTAFLDLAIRYPNARLLFSGGSGSVMQQTLKEADYVDDVFYQLGFVNHNINFERQSRNTFENATFSKEMMNPQPGETWILVTSAFHMPRSVGIFCQQQWAVVPYPVDYSTMTNNLLRIELDLTGHLRGLKSAIREWVGLVAYRVTGRSQQLFPGVDITCNQGISS